MLYLSIIGLVVLFTIGACQADIALFLNVFFVAPVLVIFTIALPLVAAFKARHQLLPALAGILVLWAIAASLFFYSHGHPFTLHETVKWLASSREYEKQVLEQPTPANGDFKHIEWDGSGFAGVANNTAYLVFDPHDSLSATAKNHQPIKLGGRSCDVRDIRRLEKDWYAVLFYTDQTWDDCN
jgi:hypothetical protein